MRKPREARSNLRGLEELPEPGSWESHINAVIELSLWSASIDHAAVSTIFLGV